MHRLGVGARIVLPDVNPLVVPRAGRVVVPEVEGVGAPEREGESRIRPHTEKEAEPVASGWGPAVAFAFPARPDYAVVAKSRPPRAEREDPVDSGHPVGAKGRIRRGV